MNIFYTPPGKVYENSLELTGQEARHASKVLRYGEGDQIMVVDGKGNRFTGIIARITGQTVAVDIKKREKENMPEPAIILGMGIIKKRDRFEFAVEKAVELGVQEIALFRGEHSVKENVRIDRLSSIVQAAMKQSLRASLPGINIFDSLEELISAFPGSEIIAAHKKGEPADTTEPVMPNTEKGGLILLVGPEGGFSDEEFRFLKDRGSKLVALGPARLRTETAAVVLTARYSLTR